MAKLKSRKFILALIGQIVGLIVLFAPQYADTIQAAAASAGALLLMALTAVGYIHGESQVDVAHKTLQTQQLRTQNIQAVTDAAKQTPKGGDS